MTYDEIASKIGLCEVKATQFPVVSSDLVLELTRIVWELLEDLENSVPLELA